ncbi:hypothetical protein NFS19_22655 (plasmid) [Paraburkholderia fungorum]|nr:hypothetical protein [Paraburkholderia fungorum]USU18532.1 hypothetical protein NFE55_22310 [Paraburkholderia fungorum]USU26405.1 hypothetical protein NFS19_22655 [Paraburkholderia fungorum]
MDNSVHVTQPVALARMRGAHRFEVFGLKLKRRLTFDRRGAVDEWIVLESDPTVRAFCERPGYVRIGDHRFLADFQVCYADRQELLLLPDPVAVDNGKPHADLDATAVTVRLLEPAELAASRIWIDNWRRMLPCLIATRDLVPTSLLNAVERFLATAQSLLAIEREFSTGDPVVACAAVFALLHAGRVSAPELRTEPLSWLTRFGAAEARP